MPVFGREEARRAGSFGSPAGRREGERGEEASRRLSGLRISPSPFGPSATASGPSSSPFRAGTASRSSSYDRNAIRSARTSLQQPSSILAPAGSRARALSPSSAAAASGGKPRSSSTTVADLLALDRLAAAGPASRTAAAHLTSSAGAATAGQVGLGFDVCYLRGSEAMAVSAQTAVFDSPTQPTTDLPAVQDAVALDVDGDREMTAAEDEIAQESRHAQAGSSCLSSGSTVGGERRRQPSAKTMQWRRRRRRLPSPSGRLRGRVNHRLHHRHLLRPKHRSACDHRQGRLSGVRRPRSRARQRRLKVPYRSGGRAPLRPSLLPPRGQRRLWSPLRLRA
jgi:hypothetical protein